MAVFNFGKLALPISSQVDMKCWQWGHHGAKNMMIHSEFFTIFAKFELSSAIGNISAVKSLAKFLSKVSIHVVKRYGLATLDRVSFD